MRTIEIRGKELNGEKWHYGYLVKMGEDYVIAKNIDIEHGELNGIYPTIDPNTIGEYVEYLDAYEGDMLTGKDTDEYGSLMSSWTGTIKYNDDKGRLMIHDEIEDLWYEIDDFDFDDIITTDGRNVTIKLSDEEKDLHKTIIGELLITNVKSKIEICKEFCKNLETHDLIHLQRALDNIKLLDLGEYDKLEGCPYDFGLEGSQETCNLDNLPEERTVRDITATCKVCWRKALGIKEESSKSVGK